MRKTNKNIWFHIEEILFHQDSKSFNPTYPAFFNVEEYKWCKNVSLQYLEIKHEFEQFISNNKLQPYFYKEQAGNTLKWKTLPLLTWNIKRKSLKRFPTTHKILQSIPGLVSASFSLLEAGGEITTHRGDTDASIRGHLCLYTAQQNEKAAFTVNNITKNWEEGRWLLFCDAHLHGGYNHSNENRLVLIVDVVHPENLDLKNKICSKVLSGLLMNFILVRFVFFDIRKLPKWLLISFYKFFDFLFKIVVFLGVKI